MNINTVILTTFESGNQSYTIKYENGVCYSFTHNEENQISNQNFSELNPEPLTAQQKLEAAGLSIEELKELLGL